MSSLSDGELLGKNSLLGLLAVCVGAGAAYLVEKNKRVDCKCKLNKIYQATISVEYTLSRKVSNSSSGL